MAYNLKDEKEVKEYLDNLSIEYRFGCYQERKPEVCHLLGDFFEAIKKDFDKASKMYEVNCKEFKFGHSCFKYANYLYTGKASLKADPNKALEFYDKGCEYKFPEACLHAGLVRTQPNSEVKPDHKKGYEDFKTGCGLNSAMSCFHLSGMYISGIPDVLAKDMTKAFEFSKMACDMGNLYACANLSQMYQKGEGTERDPAKAAMYKKKALEMQDQVVKQFKNIAFEEGG